MSDEPGYTPPNGPCQLLGRSVAAYPIQPVRRWEWSVALVLGAALLTQLATAGRSLEVLRESWPLAPSAQLALPAWGIIGELLRTVWALLLVGQYLVPLAVRFRSCEHIQLWQLGIQGRRAHRSWAIHWDQIAEVYRQPLPYLPTASPGTETGDGWQLRLVLLDGRHLVLRHVENRSDLARRIELQVKRRLFPIYRASYAQGYPVQFGRSVAVSHEGICYRYELIPWGQVLGLQMDNQRLSFRHRWSRTARERRIVIDRRHVPNWTVFTAILEMAHKAALQSRQILWDTVVDAGSPTASNQPDWQSPEGGIAELPTDSSNEPDRSIAEEPAHRPRLPR